MAKKPMTPVELSDYLSECKRMYFKAKDHHALYHSAFLFNTELCSFEELWEHSTILLKTIDRKLLTAIQKPKEVSEYSEEYLKKYRSLVAEIRVHRQKLLSHPKRNILKVA